MSTYTFVEPKPFAHQVKALHKIVERDGRAALLMDPGTGKSRVVVDYLGALWTKYGATDWLISAPTGALDTWPDQFRQWLPPHIPLEVICPSGTIVEMAAQIKALPAKDPAGPIRVVLVGHDSFSQRHLVKGLTSVSVWDRLLAAIERWGPDGLVVDESHRLKGHTSRRSKAFARVARHIPKRILLTGTVAPRWPLDIFGQWQTLDKTTFGDDWDAFKHTYAKWSGYLGKEPVRWLNQSVMRDLILKDSFVAKKKQCLDLPPVTDVSTPITLSKKEQKAYEQMESEAIVSLPSGQTAMSPIALTKFLRLRQITGGFIGFEDEWGEKVKEEIGRSKVKVCAEKLTDLTDGGHKVVVFAHFIHDLEVIAQEANKLKGVKVFGPISGDTPTKKRLEAREGFRDHDGPAVFIAQMRTMSLAVNELVCASHAIFYSLSERRDDYDQARDRLDRQGQHHPVTLYHLVVPGSIDETILNAHRDKLALETAILQYVKDKRRKA